jgi:hypothetical protein
VTIALTDEQVGKVICAKSSDSGLAEVLSGVGGIEEVRVAVAPFMGNAAYSTTTLRAALVLAALPRDGSERTVTEVAREAGFSPGVMHRYLGSWVVLGMVRQDPGSRRYRRAQRLPGRQRRA